VKIAQFHFEKQTLLGGLKNNYELLF